MCAPRRGTRVDTEQGAYNVSPVSTQLIDEFLLQPLAAVGKEALQAESFPQRVAQTWVNEVTKILINADPPELLKELSLLLTVLCHRKIQQYPQRPSIIVVQPRPKGRLFRPTESSRGNHTGSILSNMGSHASLYYLSWLCAPACIGSKQFFGDISELI